jgi:peptidoglycan/LPS O-acetylase OafA/YrhL
MKEDLFDPVPEVKLYKESAVRVGTFLGGPIIAGYLLAKNYKRLGESGKIRTTRAYSIVATVLIYVAIFLIPAIEKIPNYIIPLIYSLVASLIFQKYQGDQV